MTPIETCKLHPRYKAILPPRSTKPECTCWDMYREVHEEKERVVEAVSQAMRWLNDESTPNTVGRVIHMVDTDGKCIEATITGLHISVNVLSLDTLDRPSHFDRARLIPGTWHYADHGEWRKV